MTDKPFFFNQFIQVPNPHVAVPTCSAAVSAARAYNGVRQEETRPTLTGRLEIKAFVTSDTIRGRPAPSIIVYVRTTYDVVMVA